MLIAGVPLSRYKDLEILAYATNCKSVGSTARISTEARPALRRLVVETDPRRERVADVTAFTGIGGSRRQGSGTCG